MRIAKTDFFRLELTQNTSNLIEFIPKPESTLRTYFGMLQKKSIPSLCVSLTFILP